MSWCCYLIASITGRRNMTYIGASNDPGKRLMMHNRVDGKRKRIGAKATAGKLWSHVVVISGFPDKVSCLSFEWQWKNAARKRSNARFDSSTPWFRYETCSSSIDARILDLLHVLKNFCIVPDTCNIPLIKANESAERKKGKDEKSEKRKRKRKVAIKEIHDDVFRYCRITHIKNNDMQLISMLQNIHLMTVTIKMHSSINLIGWPKHVLVIADPNAYIS